MHDHKGRALKVGDHVLISANVTEISATRDYCNVTVESVLGRLPDGAKERISAINTNVLARANKGDDNADITG